MLDYSFHITTPRLYISHLDPSNDAHCKFIFEMNASTPEVVGPNQQTMSVTADLEAAQKSLRANYERMDRTGFGRYLLSLKPSTIPEDIHFAQLIEQCTPVGCASMQLGRQPVAPTVPDVGFRLHAQNHGKGYATEAANGLMEHYAATHGFKSFAGMCDESNLASQGVMKRLGFVNRGERDVVGVIGGGEAIKTLVWTKGVPEGDLEQWGF